MALYGVGGCPKSVPVALPALPSPAQPQKLRAGTDASLCQGKMLWPHPKESLGAGPAGKGVFGTCVWDLPNTSTSLDPQLFLSWKMGHTEAFGPLCFQIWGISRESHSSGLQGPVPGRAPQQSNRAAGEDETPASIQQHFLEEQGLAKPRFNARD